MKITEAGQQTLKGLFQKLDKDVFRIRLVGEPPRLSLSLITKDVAERIIQIEGISVDILIPDELAVEAYTFDGKGELIIAIPPKYPCH